ncbi:MAG: hypothetical protein ACUVUR_04705 [bacterium]
MVQLIDDLLDFTRIEAIAIALESIMLARLVQANVEQHRDIALKKGINLILSGDNNNLRVNADPNHIVQVLNNLWDRHIFWC